MSQKTRYRLGRTALAIVFVGVLAWPAAGTAQSVTGRARAVNATTTLRTTVLADTGALGGIRDARNATLDTGDVPSLLSGEVLHAVTIGWPDQVASEASLANLKMTVAGTGISADFVMARALAVLNAGATVSSLIGNLLVNGMAIAVTGDPNQTVAIPGGRVVINEQTVSPTGSTVNAIHAKVFGVADVVIASATAGIR
jgi:hypothetical protein